MEEDLVQYNRLLQFYRGRVEHTMNILKSRIMSFRTPWRSSFALLQAVARITAHMNTLQESMRLPRPDV